MQCICCKYINNFFYRCVHFLPSAYSVSFKEFYLFYEYHKKICLWNMLQSKCNEAQKQNHLYAVFSSIYNAKRYSYIYNTICLWHNTIYFLHVTVPHCFSKGTLRFQQKPYVFHTFSGKVKRLGSVRNLMIHVIIYNTNKRVISESLFSYN